uniref:Uncharacterized protein n=1 Tax=viral metagenome TaxID=1070528 RepID=A0A6M3M7T9_9ZZZZ
MKTYTAKDLKQALAKVPDDSEVFAIMDGTLIVEHYSWTEQKTVDELHGLLLRGEVIKAVTLTWTTDDAERMFLEEKDRHPPSLQEINEILTEFDNEVHDRLTPTGNELMREIINRA